MLLEVDKLNTFYGNLHAIWDISIEVGEGEIVALFSARRDDTFFRACRSKKTCASAAIRGPKRN